MRQAEIKYKGRVAGQLSQEDDGSFTFSYDAMWLADNTRPPISVNLPKLTTPYRSQNLFPFFFNMLPEGYNKEILCKSLRIDKDDHFGLLLNVAEFDTVGAVTLRRIPETK
jgi:HipA-like protein